MKYWCNQNGLIGVFNSEPGMYAKWALLSHLVLLFGCVGYRTPLDTLPDAGIPCKPGNQTLIRAQPTVMFVLDRSTSMKTAMDSGNNSSTRWAALSSALAAVLPSVDNAVAVGALLFPATTSENQGCSVASKADLPPAMGQVAALTRLMKASSPGGATPTADAIDTAAKLMLGLRAATSARALVLATDGAPDCNDSLNVSTCRCVGSSSGMDTCSGSTRCLDDTRTIQTIAKYQAQGLPTYVVGIQTTGDTEYSDVLDTMAIVGGRARAAATHSYYVASSESELNSALAAIRDQVGACTYLTASVPDQNGSITINLDGSEIASDQWTWGNRSNGEIILLGDICQTVVAVKNTALTAVIACTDS